MLCQRMARALGMGDVYLDASLYRMAWCVERIDKNTLRFNSIGEMERHLERLIQQRKDIQSTYANVKRTNRRSTVLFGKTNNMQR